MLNWVCRKICITEMFTVYTSVGEKALLMFGHHGCRYSDSELQVQHGSNSHYRVFFSLSEKGLSFADYTICSVLLFLSQNNNTGSSNHPTSNINNNNNNNCTELLDNLFNGSSPSQPPADDFNPRQPDTEGFGDFAAAFGDSTVSKPGSQ